MKKILVVALSVALLLSTTACGTNSELEAIKQKNEQLKQTIDELQKDLAQQTSSPQSTDAPKQSDYLASDGNIAVTKQETYGDRGRCGHILGLFYAVNPRLCLYSAGLI